MIALRWDAARQVGDVGLTALGALAEDDGLATAVTLSLMLDRVAEADDELPDGGAGLFRRRGWIGDALTLGEGAPAEDRIGSRLWLLARAKQTEETRRLAEDHAREALAWLVEDGLAAEVTVAAEWVSRGLLGLEVQIRLPGGDSAAFSYGLRTA